MALVSTKKMFTRAYKEKYAIGAFNLNNMETIQGIVDAAKEVKAPLILQVSAGARKYARHIYLMKLIEAAIQDSDLPIAIHLDHGDSFELCKSCIDNGFTSVMIDASHYSFEKNIAITKEVVEYAHAHGVVVEAELGRLAGIEDLVQVNSASATYTDPEQAVQFVKKTKVDSLAIAIGTSHGAYKFKGEANLDFNRLEKISNLLPDFPLVLHGASSVIPEFVEKINNYGGKIPGAQGVPENMLRRAANLGICKINIDSDLRLAMTGTIREYLAHHPNHFDPRQYLSSAREAIKTLVKHKIINVLGCAHKI